MFHRGNYPMYSQNNISPTDRNLYVSCAHCHVSALNENTEVAEHSNDYIIHYIYFGKYKVGNRILTPGNGFLVSPETERYSLRAMVEKSCFAKIHVGGYMVRKFLINCCISPHTHIFSHPKGTEIAELIKKVACGSYDERDIDFVLTALLYNVMSYHKTSRLIQKNPFRAAINPADAQLPYLRVVLNYIDEHYAENISVKELAEMVHLTPNYLSSTFKKIFGLPLQLYIKKYRISIADKLLSDTSLSVGAIAGMVGYPDAQHFSQVFKSLMHYTPSKYREATKR